MGWRRWTEARPPATPREWPKTSYKKEKQSFCAVQFCVFDVQATVNHSLYYRSHSARAPLLFAVTSRLVKYR
uniref:Uncharacterized protein n=1 Tax=Romanomermis culicivorax TaxID=13658 RepID=A0A915KHG4_ROMCU